MLITHEFLNSLVNSRECGVSGLMRVNNEEKTVRQSIESVINVVDELVIIYHNCVDNTIEILEELSIKYTKISLFEYTQYVIPANSGGYVEGFNPCHSLANYYNYGLSKCKYNWFLKIDADQIYFEDELKDLFNNRQPLNYYCMVGFNVTVDNNNNISVGSYDSVPINGHHGDHFLTEIKIDSRFIIPKNDSKSYCQTEQYSEPGICWDKFNFTIGSAFWYHVRYFKDKGIEFYLSEEEIQTVDKFINFNYLRERLCDKFSDSKISKLIECFHKNKFKLTRDKFI